MADAVLSQAGADVVSTIAADAVLSQAGADVIVSGGTATVPAIFSQAGAEVLTRVLTQSAPALLVGLNLELDGPGNGWTNVDDDVRTSEGIRCFYGIVGSDPSDRVASTGNLSFALDNSANNSAETVGYYSPLHPSKRPGFDFNIAAQWSLQFGTTRRYKHLGKLADIVPSAGAHGERIVRCQSLDYMDDAARIDVPDLNAQRDLRADELLTLILNDLTTQPEAREFGIGVDRFRYALDGGSGQQQKVREEFNKIALSEQGYVFIKGDASQGGTLAFQPRGARTADATTHLTLDDDMTGLVMTGSRDDIVKTVQVIVHPTLVDGAATTVLFSLPNASVLVAAGATVDTIFGPYRNPETDDPCGGTDMVVPVASTDYTMNAAEDGSGTDLTSSFTVTASYTGQGVRYTLVNGSGSDGYVTKLEARGRGVYRTDVTVEQSVTGSYGDRVLTLDLPYQSSVTAATSIATYLATLLASPVARVKSVRFNANRSDDFMDAALVREPGDRIALTETVTGLNADLFVIQNVTLELHAPDILWCTWGLVPWGLDPWWVANDFTATGGTITQVGGYTIHTFTSNGTFAITAGDPTSIQYLIVGGGAGGGGDDLNSSGGGGGGGGQAKASAVTLGIGSYGVTVGAGGAGGSTLGTSGSSSVFNGITSAGGSGGGGGGTNGASGTIGGGGGADDSINGGAGGVGSVFSGGAGGSNGGGGGAGAGGPGGTAPGFNIGGAGGNGITSSISGTAVGYGGGGSGGAYATPIAGTHGGGTGATFAGAGSAGTTNRGGGGGGGRFGNGGAGGSGIVIVRYPTAS